MFEGVVIRDADGNERTVEWLKQRYGNINIRKASDGDGYRVVALYENFGAPVLQVMVTDEQKVETGGVPVARHWPYRDANPELDQLPEGLATWFSRGPWGETKEDGVVGFGTGAGDFYWPKDGQTGASTLWCNGLSDAVEGLGILQETGYPHMIPVFQWTTDEPPPPDEVKKLILDAKLDLAKANLRLDEALRLLP